MSPSPPRADDAIAAEKRRIRDAVRARRRARTASEREIARDRLTAHLSALVTARGAQSVCCYLPLATEPDTSGFLDWASRNGIEVLLPTSQEGHRLGWIRPDGSGRTTQGRHGIAEPIGVLLPGSAAESVDLMLIPACAVDERGMRLGWGLGYYDRCLASLDRRPPVFAIVHDDELLPTVPAESHDTPVTGVVTPERTTVFDAGGPGTNG